MGPMFEDLERAMSEQIKQLDKLEELVEYLKYFVVIYIFFL